MLRVEELKKQFVSDTGVVDALRGVSLETRPGEIYTLLGPSGCGKSTLLRSVAGLEVPNAGRIITGGDKVLFSLADGINVTAHLRGVGMVFQSYAIWPHMTVFENVAFPLRYGNFRVPKSALDSSVMRALDMVQLGHLADRPAPLLSGGQQQRVALARALVYEPTILLLDEPLSNLDAKLRVVMRDEIQEIIKSLGVTALYVTHDQDEALAISDRIAVMSEGRIEQEGTPHEVYAHPANLFVAQFVGKTNLMKGVVTEISDDVIRVTSGTLIVSASSDAAPDQLAVGDEVDICVRPEDVVVHQTASSAINSFPVEVERTTFLGGYGRSFFRLGDTRLEAEAHGVAFFGVGDSVFVELPPDGVKLFHAGESVAETMDSTT